MIYPSSRGANPFNPLSLVGFFMYKSVANQILWTCRESVCISVIQIDRLVGPRPKRFQRTELPKYTTSQQGLTEVNSNTRVIKSEINK